MAKKHSTVLGLTTIQLIHQDVIRLLAQGKIYQQLFSEKENTIILNSIAPTTFGLLQQSLQESMVLGLARTLCDPASAGRNENLGLETLLNGLPGDNEDLEDRLRDLRKKYSPIKFMRNKIYGHRDEPTSYAVAYRQKVNDQEVLCDTDLLDAIEEIGWLMQECMKRIGMPNSYLEQIEGPDGDKLMEVLRFCEKRQYSSPLHTNT